jgi:hypothetical protein
MAVDRTVPNPEESPMTPMTENRAPVPLGTRQTITGLRVWGGRDSIRATFAVSTPVTSVTMWVQSSGSFDVLLYRHFSARAATREWDVTFADLPAGSYEVILDVPDPAPGAEHRSWSGRVEV